MLARRVTFVASSLGLLSGAFLAVLTGGAGCTHDRPEAEATVDAQLPDTNVEVSVVVPPIAVLVDKVDSPADVSCNGISRPDAGPIVFDGAADDAGADAGADDAAVAPLGLLVNTDVEVIAFGSGGADKLSKQTVDVYYGNTFKSAPDLPGLVTDDKGMLRLKLPAGLRVGYHVRSSDLLNDFWGLDDMHVPVDGNPFARWQGITKERQEVLALAVTGEKGYVLKPNTGIVSARLVDCQRRYLQFGKLTLRDYTDDAAGKELEFGKCADGLCIVYLSDTELPDPARTYTSRSGLVAMINVPAGRKLALVATGRTPDGALVQFARRMLEVEPGALVSHYVEPSNDVKF